MGEETGVGMGEIETILQHFEIELSNEANNLDEIHEELRLTEEKLDETEKSEKELVEFAKRGQEVKMRKLKLQKELKELKEKKWKIERNSQDLCNKLGVMEKVFEKVGNLTEENQTLQTELETEKKANRNLTLQLDQFLETIDGLKAELAKEKGNGTEESEDETDFTAASPANTDENSDEFSLTLTPPAGSTTPTRGPRLVWVNQPKSQKRKHSDSEGSENIVGFPLELESDPDNSE